jgi:hypothetical protein
MRKMPISPWETPPRIWKCVRLALILPLLLFSCSKESRWAFDEVYSEQREFCSTKLTWRPPDPINSVHVELLNTQEHLRVYLNILSTPVSPYRGDPKKALLTMDIDGQKCQYEIRRLEGGQRFLLSDEIANALIDALQNQRSVTLSLPGYSARLIAEDFSSKYKKLLHHTPFCNPFHMPF